MTRLPVLCVSLLAALLTACGGETTGSADMPPPEAGRAATTDSATASTPAPAGIADHCVAPGQARARQIQAADFRLEGPNAIAGQGDFLLANSRAMFAISGLGEQKTYYHYPGILVDAVAVADCEQQSDDHFFELPLMVGKLNPFNQPRSTFRAFQAQQIEVINDGRDGNAAIVRATGTDSYYWLLELTLMGEAVLGGLPKYLSDPFDLRIEVDYILQPDSPTLNIHYRLINTRDTFNSFTIAFVLMSSGEGASLNNFSAFDLNVEGLALQHGIPWVATRDPANAYVYSARTSVLTTTEISGVSALLDARQLANTYLGQLLTAAGTPGDSHLQQFDLTVSAGDEFTAVKQHLQHVPVQSPLVNTPLQIRVTDSLSGEPVANAEIRFQTRKQVFLQNWPWETFLTAHTDGNGEFSDSVPLLRYIEAQDGDVSALLQPAYIPAGLDQQAYRVVVAAPGRADSTPVSIERADRNGGVTQNLAIALQSAGELRYTVVDEDGKPSPAKITLFQNGRVVTRIYSATGQGSHPLAPGAYRVVVSRGFEYALVDTTLDIPATGHATLAAELEHWVDTRGYLSYDGHVHSSPSPDSEVSKEDRIRTAAAEGLEIVVATDHEIITDLAPGVINAGAQDVLATIIGQEVTASLPNHTIAFPLRRDPAKVRDFVPWYSLDIAQVFAAEKDFGARIRTFAHPRGSYLDIIQWDRIAGAPGATLDPRQLGLPADAALWSWDFEAMEFMNGPQRVFSSGIFEDWMSFLNHGHRIIATGASDVHGFETPGTPRTYFSSATDHAPDFSIDEMVASVTGGDVVVSLGAFARVRVNGVAGLGDTLTDQDGEVEMQLQVEAIPQIDVDHARIYVNCDEVLRLPMSNPADSAIKFADTLTIPVPVGRDAHIVVLGFGAQRLPDVFEQFDPAEVPRFATNPVFVDRDGNGEYDAPGGKACRI